MSGVGDGIEVRFNALILWERLSLHDIIQSLIIPVFSLALSDSVFVLFIFVLNLSGKFSLYIYIYFIIALLLNAFENSP